MRKIVSTVLMAGAMVIGSPVALAAGNGAGDEFKASTRTFPGGHKVADQFPHRFKRDERSEFARVETAENEPAASSNVLEEGNPRRFD